MNNRLFLTALAIMAGLITGCSSDDEGTPGGESPSPAKTERRISVEVSERPITPDAAQTRAVISTIESLNGFSMHCIYNGEKRDYAVTKSDNDWTVEPDTWPNVDNKITFYAHSGGSFFKDVANCYVSFLTSEDAFNQHDLLVASSTVAYSDRNGKVPLTFSHACAAVRFHVQMSNTLSSNLGLRTLTVSSITLRNVYNCGEYVFGTGWRNVGSAEYPTSDYTLTNGNIEITATSQPLPTDYLFLIPQSRKDAYLEVGYTVAGGTGKTAFISLPTGWEAGKEYNINIKLGTTLIEL